MMDTGKTNDGMTCGGGWEDRYQAGDAPWDLGAAPPHLQALVDGLDAAALQVFIPGAGRGHDAVPWARAGHEVTALDIAPTAIAEGQAILAAQGVDITWVVGDLFDLPEAFEGAFDVVWEQTCFCAIHPDQRPAYAEAVANVLRPGGVLHGVLWQHGKDGGPPWNLTPDIARDIFGGLFEIESLEPIPDWGEARWNEFGLRARKRVGV